VTIGTAGAGAAPLEADTELGNLDTAQGRVAALNMITQNRDPNDPDKHDDVDKVDCGPSTIVAGVLYSEGPKGIGKLLDDMKGDHPDREESPQVKALRDKLANGQPLTIGDIQNVQHDLYMDIKTDGMTPEAIDAAIHSKDLDEQRKAYVGGDAMESFLKRHGDVTAMFHEHHLGVSNIDTDADGTGDHWVLDVDDAKGKTVAVIDSWKKGGKHGQITNAEDGDDPYDPSLGDYRQAETGRSKR
jgi:hypothetical protein